MMGRCGMNAKVPSPSGRGQKLCSLGGIAALGSRMMVCCCMNDTVNDTVHTSR